VIYDASSGRDIQLTVGYAREAPYLTNELLTDVVPIIPVGSTNGNLLITVVNPLVGGNDVSPTNIFIFARAKSNMDFAVPRESLRFIDFEVILGPAIYDIKEHLILQGALGDNEAEGPIIQDLVPSSGSFPSDQLYFGEIIRSARALMQKPCQTSKTLYTKEAQVPLPFLAPPCDAIFDTIPFTFTYAGWYMSLFTYCN
jgi:hypothetical protein